jgi:DNA-binding response OmpR family regulator
MAKVLVIDDDATMRRLIHRTLANAGHEVVEAADGVQGMRTFLTHAPAVVITDLIMPDQEGIQTIREIRAAGSRAGIIAISGGGVGDGSLYLTLARELGANEVLPKPFRPAELIALVEKLLAA